MMITLAADFGGQRIKLGLIENGAVIGHQVLPAEAGQPLQARLQVVCESMRQLCQQAGIPPDQCRGVGFAYPSIIHTPSARILDHFGKFGDARSLDLKGWARESLGLPLAVDNDARMALIGEWQYGAGRGCNNLSIITLGTGLGASALIEGQLVRGAHGQAGILGGHLTVRYGGRPCVCGNLGCAESEASTSVLARLAQECADFSGSLLATEPVLDYAAIFRLASRGDPCACALRAHSLQVWSALAVNLIHAYDPEKLILAGGVMGSGATILPFIREYVARHAHTPWGTVQIVPSELGDRAALLACEWLVQEQFGNA